MPEGTFLRPVSGLLASAAGLAGAARSDWSWFAPSALAALWPPGRKSRAPSRSARSDTKRLLAADDGVLGSGAGASTSICLADGRVDTASAGAASRFFCASAAWSLPSSLAASSLSSDSRRTPFSTSAMMLYGSKGGRRL